MIQKIIDIISKARKTTGEMKTRRTIFTMTVAFILTGIVLGLVGTTITARTIPTFNILSVAVNDHVTIRTYNFPASMDFTVRMNYIGTKGVGGTIVGTTNSGSGGTFDATYDIPDYLKGQAQIAIRMDSSSGVYYAYNWFYNDTTAATITPGGPTVTPGSSYSGIPTFHIQSEIVDTSVTIHTSNFPAGQTFTVRMNYMHTKGIGGTVVGTTDSGSGGAFNATYNIPDYLKGQYQIAIRMDSASGAYYAYNWFYNSTTAPTNTPGGPTSTPGGYTGIPTFSIIGVSKDSTVTIRTNNFPAGKTFTVLMNYRGTKGIGGTVVATTDSGSGGTFTATYDIPDYLKGQSSIAIRMESGVYYAYNWFNNQNYP